MGRKDPGTTTPTVVSLPDSVLKELGGLDARIKNLETRFELHQHGPALAELEIKQREFLLRTIQPLTDRLDRHAAALKQLREWSESRHAQVRKLFHEVNELKSAAPVQRDLFGNL